MSTVTIVPYSNDWPLQFSRVQAELLAAFANSAVQVEHIAFRNALRSDSSLLAEYHSVKIELAARFPDDKSSYAAAKAPFIRSALTSLQQAVGTSNSFKPKPLRGST